MPLGAKGKSKKSLKRYKAISSSVCAWNRCLIWSRSTLDFGNGQRRNIIAGATVALEADLRPSASSKKPLRQFPQDTDWQRLFLARATRRVRLDATISLQATLWEVPVHLRGRQVQLRYEPFAWSVVEVWHRDTFARLARRCDKHLNAKTYGSADYERKTLFIHRTQPGSTLTIRLRLGTGSARAGPVSRLRGHSASRGGRPCQSL